VATVVTVHGTFAHTGGTADALNIGADQEVWWWQPGSEFEKHTRELVAGEDGRLDFVPFVWNAWNSEISRREAGSNLLNVLRELEARHENYCLVGHSHGGSVIAAALLESSGRGKPLEHLRSWFTVGTPFVELRKERFLFSRLSLTRKVVFVASAMLLMMFLFYAAGEIASGAPNARNENYYTRLIFSAAMMSIPFMVFYTAFKFMDGRDLFSYGRKAVRTFRDSYAPKWRSFYHKDDEAVQGLRYLPKVNLSFFEKDFAVSTITMASVLVLPLLYLFVMTSPTAMVGLANFLRDTVYGVDQYKNVETQVVAAREEMRQTMREMRKAREESESNGLSPATAEGARQRANDLRLKLRDKRRNMESAHPEFAEAERALRYKRRFLQKDGVDCEGGTLCGGGRDYALNSKLLYHVVTDELASAVVNDEWGFGAMGGVVRLLVPIVLVPLFFAVLALGILAIIEYAAAFVSSMLSTNLNKLTLSELKRSAFGNDTDGEIALGVDYRPSWIKESFHPLPADLSDKITEQSNSMAYLSLAKFRNAISTLAFAEGADKAGLVSNYLSWKELIHTSYFDVPLFRKLVAQAISQTPGFTATDAFRHDRDYEATKKWLEDITVVTAPDGSAPPMPVQAFPA
jgi:hypothetical protein